jgi:hypothetical protein
MTSVNLNVQNSYAALYSTSLAQTNNQPRNMNIGSAAETAANITGRGENLTLSAEAIALSQQTSEPTPPTEVTPLGSGTGIRPPEVAPLGGGPGIRPPEVTPFGGGPGIRPPATP